MKNAVEIESESNQINTLSILQILYRFSLFILI